MSPLIELVQSLGHDLKKEGKTWKGCCPFHDDATPSLSLDPDKDLWHCFGCGAGGDGISFLQKYHKLSFGEAADRWRDLTGQDPKYSTTTRKGKPVKDQTSEDLTVLERLQQLYARELSTNLKALTYLEKRGITNTEAVNAFGLGYVSGHSLPELNPDQTTHLQSLGILNEKGQESLYGCIVCPLYNEQGQVVSFWGRRN